MKQSIYDQVTSSIITQLETGCAPWVRPWRTTTADGIPTNLSTGNAYRGINVILLWAEAMQRGFEHDYWLTYKQAQSIGGQVIKGAKSAHIVKYGTYERERENSAGETEKSTGQYLKGYSVFNIAEIDGIDIPEPIPLAEHERDTRIDSFIASTGATMRHSSGRAFYNISADSVSLPEMGRFGKRSEYYATALHELTHWTGHKSRMGRDIRNSFGSPNYAREELIAEMGAAFLCASLGIDGQLQHAEYIDSWLRVLREDNRAIFKAASAAGKAADYLHGFSDESRIAA